jgi:hypothetical protein
MSAISGQTGNQGVGSLRPSSSSSTPIAPGVKLACVQVTRSEHTDLGRESLPLCALLLVPPDVIELRAGIEDAEVQTREDDEGTVTVSVCEILSALRLSAG